MCIVLIAEVVFLRELEIIRFQINIWLVYPRRISSKHWCFLVEVLPKFTFDFNHLSVDLWHVSYDYKISQLQQINFIATELFKMAFVWASCTIFVSGKRPFSLNNLFIYWLNLYYLMLDDLINNFTSPLTMCSVLCVYVMYLLIQAWLRHTKHIFCKRIILEEH